MTGALVACRPVALTPKASSRRRGGDAGYVLVAALLMLASVSGMAAGLIHSGWTESRTAAAMRENAALDTAAEGAIQVAVFRLLQTPAARGAASGVFQLRLPSGMAVVRFDGLDGRIDANLASPRLLFALLRQVGAGDSDARMVTALIVDGRGGTSNTGPPAPFRDMADLARRTGMAPPILALLAPHLTVWWSGLPNPKFAAPAVNDALAMAGENELAGAVQPAARVLMIDAEVTARSGRSVRRRAVVRLGLRDDGLSWDFLAWDPALP